MNFMKPILNKLYIALAAILLFAGCKKDAVLTYMDVVTFPSGVTASTNSVVLSADNLDSSVITLSWPAAGADGFKLETTTALGGTWSEVTTSTTTEGGMIKATLPIEAAGARFFRLTR